MIAALSFPAVAQSPRDVATRLGESVVELTRAGNPTCTATKIGPTKFLTAKHCVTGLDTNFRLEFGFDYSWPKSVTIPIDKKSDGRAEDWATLTTFQDVPKIKIMELGCLEEIYLGMPVAFLGFSYPTAPSFSMGMVSSVEKTRNSSLNSDFTVDVQAGPGASGSSIMSVKSGRIIGVLVEAVMAQRGMGMILVGVQAIRYTDMCDDLPRLAQAEPHGEEISF